MTLPKCKTKYYVVKSKKRSTFSCEELRGWFIMYCTRDVCNRDSHQEFSEYLGVTKEEAESLSHSIAKFAYRGVDNLGLIK